MHGTLGSASCHLESQRCVYATRTVLGWLLSVHARTCIGMHCSAFELAGVRYLPSALFLNCSVVRLLLLHRAS